MKVNEFVFKDYSNLTIKTCLSCLFAYISFLLMVLLITNNNSIKIITCCISFPIIIFISFLIINANAREKESNKFLLAGIVLLFGCVLLDVIFCVLLHMTVRDYSICNLLLSSAFILGITKAIATYVQIKTINNSVISQKKQHKAIIPPAIGGLIGVVLVRVFSPSIDQKIVILITMVITCLAAFTICIISNYFLKLYLLKKYNLTAPHTDSN